jgi:hypothetical protein
MEPVANLPAASVDRKGVAVQGVQDHQRFSFSGYWRGPYAFEPRQITASTP